MSSVVRLTEADSHTQVAVDVDDAIAVVLPDGFDRAQVYPVGGDPGPVTRPLVREDDWSFVAVCPGRARIAAQRGEDEIFEVTVRVRASPGMKTPFSGKG